MVKAPCEGIVGLYTRLVARSFADGSYRHEGPCTVPMLPKGLRKGTWAPQLGLIGPKCSQPEWSLIVPVSLVGSPCLCLGST